MLPFAPLLFAAFVPLLFEMLRYDPPLRAAFSDFGLTPTAQIILGVAALCAFLIHTTRLLRMDRRLAREVDAIRQRLQTATHQEPTA